MNLKRWTMRVSVRLVCAAMVVGLGAVPCAAAGQEYDIIALINDTQKQTPDPDRMTVVWWLPEEFWDWSLSQDDTVTEEGAREFLEILEPYTLLGVVDGELGPLGGATFIKPKDLRAMVVLIDAKGNRYTPLSDDAVSADALNLATMMQPILANMLGPMGENFAFFFFKAKAKNGTPVAVATKKGSFSVEVGDQKFDWKTPLGSVLPAKVCPVDGEEMSGAWAYCPWHGKELKIKEKK